MSTQRSQFAEDLFFAPDEFGGTVSIGDGNVLVAETGVKFLVYQILIVPNAPGATLEVVQLWVNGNASTGQELIRCNVVGDENEVRFQFKIPILVDNVFMERIAGTGSLYAGVFAKRVLLGGI